MRFCTESMPVSKYKYQIFVSTWGGWKAYYGTNDKTQWLAVQYKLKRQGKRIKTKVK